MIDEVWATKREAAEITGTSITAIRKWAKEGKIKTRQAKPCGHSLVEVGSVGAYKAAMIGMGMIPSSSRIRFRSVNIDGQIATISLRPIGGEYGDTAIIETLENEIRITIRKDEP